MLTWYQAERCVTVVIAEAEQLLSDTTLQWRVIVGNVTSM